MTTWNKPRVERSVPYVRSNFFAGEDFRDIDDCRACAEHWCAAVAGMRVHGTTRLHPAEVFATEELPELKPVPDEVFDIPTWTHPKVAPDRHVQVAKRSTASPVSWWVGGWMPGSMPTRSSCIGVVS